MRILYNLSIALTSVMLLSNSSHASETELNQHHFGITEYKTSTGHQCVKPEERIKLAKKFKFVNVYTFKNGAKLWRKTESNSILITSIINHKSCVIAFGIAGDQLGI